MRETSTIFQVSFKHRLLGGKHAQLADAVLTGMSTEGYKAAYLRMDDEGNIAHTNPMRIFCGKASAEDFTYMPCRLGGKPNLRLSVWPVSTDS